MHTPHTPDPSPPLPSSISLSRSFPLLPSLPSFLPSTWPSPSLYRRLSSRLSTSPSTSLPMPLLPFPPSSHPHPPSYSSSSSSRPFPSLSPPHKPHPHPHPPPSLHIPPPLPLPTPHLPSHSLYLLTTTHQLTVLSSVSYLAFNFLRSFYHQRVHWAGWMWVADVSLFGTNVVMMGCGVRYWVAYAERARWDWEMGKGRGKDEGRVVGRGTSVADGNPRGETEEEQAELLLHATASSDSPLSPSSVDSSFSPSPSSTSSSTSETLPFSTPSTSSPPPFSSLASRSLVWSMFFLTMCHSSTFYLASLPGAAEVLNLVGTLLYLLSSLIPLTLSSINFFHLPPLTEPVEAALDELQYALDALAMTLYVVGSLLYLHLWRRAHAALTPMPRGGMGVGVGAVGRGVGGMVVGYLLDTELWANVWNVAGSVCYAVSVYYGLAIRVHAAEMERMRGGGREGMEGVVSEGVVAADDLSDLSEWQRALYGLTLNQKVLMSMGDLVYMISALLTARSEGQAAVAEEGERRRRGKGMRGKGEGGRRGAGGGLGGMGSDRPPIHDPKQSSHLPLSEVEVT